jgi:hypothetical protein
MSRRHLFARLSLAPAKIVTDPTHFKDGDTHENPFLINAYKARDL